MEHRLSVIIFLVCYLVFPVGVAYANPVTVHAIIPAQSVTISDLSYSPSPFNPTATQAEISFSLSKTATVTGTIFDMSGTPVNILAPSTCWGGANRLYWDGRNFAGSLVAPSWYRLFLEAGDGTSTDAKTLIIAVSYGKPLIMKSLGVDPKRFNPKKSTAKFKVSLSRDAYVSVTIKSKSGATVKAVTDIFWRQGENIFQWDGSDDSGFTVKPGTYTCKISGRDSGGNSASVSENITVVDDSKSTSTLINGVADWFSKLLAVIQN